MMHAVVDFALNESLLVLAGTLLLFAWGIILFNGPVIQCHALQPGAFAGSQSYGQCRLRIVCGLLTGR
jgi:hypothetical protein